MHQIEIGWQPKDLLPARIPVEVRHAILTLPMKWHRRALLARALAGEEIPEQVLQPVDYSYSPASYWDPENLHQLVANIKGAERKREALRLIDEGHLDEASEFILADTLSEEDRARAGKVHPALLGGEFLPDYEASEVEIARVTLASTTQDVISIRAFPKAEGIGYRVVDEYNSKCEFSPQFSHCPLSLRKLLFLIETANRPELGHIGLGLIQNQLNCSGNAPESFTNFMAFSSEFYADLSTHYWFEMQRFVERNRIGRVAL